MKKRFLSIKRQIYLDQIINGINGWMYGFEALNLLTNGKRVGKERRLGADDVRRRRGGVGRLRGGAAAGGRGHLGVSGVNRDGPVRRRHSHGLRVERERGARAR